MPETDHPGIKRLQDGSVWVDVELMLFPRKSLAKAKEDELRDIRNQFPDPKPLDESEGHVAPSEIRHSRGHGEALRGEIEYRGA